MAEQQMGATGIRVMDTNALHEAAKLMGQVSTQAKAAAARENGKRGGRPKGIPMSPEARRKISESRRKQTTLVILPLPADISPTETL